MNKIKDPTWSTWDNVSEWSINIDNQEGFVYKITHLTSGKRYYGIKKFKNKLRRKPLKGKKRVRRCFVESDWRTYNTSSPILEPELRNRPLLYKKEIMRVCDTVTEMKAYEAFMQLSEYLNGTWSDVINEVINLRLRIRK